MLNDMLLDARPFLSGVGFGGLGLNRAWGLGVEGLAV